MSFNIRFLHSAESGIGSFYIKKKTLQMHEQLYDVNI